MDVLVHLLTHHDRVVSADEVLDEVWPDRHGDPGMVKKRIGQIRHALGDDARQPTYIETIARRGYRTIAPVSSIRDPENSLPEPDIASGRTTRPWWRFATITLIVPAAIALWLTFRTPPSPLDLSVAVTPMAVVGDHGRLAPFAAGLTQELEGLLTDYPELRTVATPRSESAPATASYQVNGSVPALGDDLRVRVRLIRVPDAESIWSTTFQGPIEESAHEQTRIAVSIGRFVRLELVKDYQCETVREKSRVAEAAALVCAAQAQHYAVQQGGSFDAWTLVRSARRAVALDPELAEAYFFLAMGLNLLHGLGMSDLDEVEAEAHAALDRGLKLAPPGGTRAGVRARVPPQALLLRHGHGLCRPG